MTDAELYKNLRGTIAKLNAAVAEGKTFQTALHGAVLGVLVEEYVLPDLHRRFMMNDPGRQQAQAGVACLGQNVATGYIHNQRRNEVA